MAIDKSGYDEIWVTADDGQSMVALINGNVGWLMYLRWDGDAGFSSRNPNYDGPSDAMIDYFLSNGQNDDLPLFSGCAEGTHFRQNE